MNHNVIRYGVQWGKDPIFRSGVMLEGRPGDACTRARAELFTAETRRAQRERRGIL